MEGECTSSAHEKRRGKVRLCSLDDLDHRTTAAKRAASLVSGLESDAGGADQVSVGQRELIKRAALLGAFIEDCEVRWLQHERVEVSEYLAAINAQRRVLATIGLERKPRSINDIDANSPEMAAYREAVAEIEAEGEPA